ncbi:MAG: small ribosomal subunit Rsm22 family protein [Rhizomicrobium sp.]
MNPALPAALKAAADALLQGVSRKELAAHSTAITAQYRAGRGSASAVTSEADTLAYLVARMPATYAVAAAALAQIRDAAPGFAPASLLDVGAGPGTASWAARETWPALKQVTLTDSNARFLDLARKLVPEAEHLARNLVSDDLPNADLVIASFVLAEIAPAAQQPVVEKLHAAAADVLLLIEPGTPQGFERIRAARKSLIGQGAHVLAPCPHANLCPMLPPDWCHFSQRLPRSRDHMQAKGANVPYEDERYSWLAVSRARRSAFDGQARVLATPKERKPGVELKLCTPAGLEHRFVAKRDREAFALTRKAAWGDVVWRPS